MKSLPTGWTAVTLGSIGEWRGGGTPSKSVDSFWMKGTIPWVSPKDMKRAIIDDTEDKLTSAALRQSSTKLVPPGSVLMVVRSGILKHSFPVAVTAREVAINQDIKALIPHPGVNSTFVALQLRAEARNILDVAARAGTTVDSVSIANLKQFEIRMAPTKEQERIVQKLQPLLARCATARAELARVSGLASRRRQAALSSAFRGTLIDNGPSESTNQNGWATVSLGSLLSEPLANGFSPPSSRDAKGAYSLKLTATTSGYLRLDAAAVKRVQVTPSPDSKYWLKTGDLLVQRANSLEHVGAAAIYEGEESKYIYPDLMIRIRISDELTRRYVWRYLNSPAARRYFQDNATGTAGNMPKITGMVLSSLQIPMAPREKMGAILDRLDHVFARLEAVEQENMRCAGLVDKLEHSFLVKAFKGQLVRQDLSDEPAATMLQQNRIAKNSEKTNMCHLVRSVSEAVVDNVTTYLERRLATLPADGATFEQLRMNAPGTYEELKDAIFELLNGVKLIQRYDQREKRMKFVRPS
jgi:type I restriction enzyme S subunit